MRVLVFLDFDDVIALNPVHDSHVLELVIKYPRLGSASEIYANLFDPAAQANLKALHDEFLPNYVITSSWTGFLNKQQIGVVLRQCGLEFVALSLHDRWCTKRDEDSYRLSEIQAWLDGSGSDENDMFVVLDDELSGQSLPGSDLEANTVLCEPGTGFTQPYLEKARRIFQDQLKLNVGEFSKKR